LAQVGGVDELVGPADGRHHYLFA
jgi:hypothetical protein